MDSDTSIPEATASRGIMAAAGEAKPQPAVLMLLPYIVALAIGALLVFTSMPGGSAAPAGLLQALGNAAPDGGGWGGGPGDIGRPVPADPDGGDDGVEGGVAATGEEGGADNAPAGQPDPPAPGGGTSTQTPADPNAGKTWHPGWEERVLVSNAWTEYVYHPAAYSTIHHEATGHHGSRCNQCGSEITGFAGQHITATDNCWSYTNMYWFVDSPAWDEQVMVNGEWTEEVYHPAEYRTVYHEGYWE